MHVLFSVAASCLMGAFTTGADWPEFRGPTGQGLYEGPRLPTNWGKTKNLIWRQEIAGLGWSSPIVFAGRVYLTTAVPVGEGPPKDQSLRVICLNGESGKILWEREVFREDGATAPAIHGKNSHASPTPITDGQQLYVHFGHQGTAALNFDGDVIWRNTSLHYAPVHGNGGSPILVGDALVFSCDGGDLRFLAALRTRDGTILWKTNRAGDVGSKFSFSTPLLIEVHGKKQVVSPGTGSVNAYDPSDGKEIWRVRYQGYSVIPRPVYGHGLVFISTGYDSPSLLAIRPDGQGDVTDTHIAWKTRRKVSNTPSFLLAGDELFMVSDDGFASCLDARSGKLHWQERIGGSYSASPVHADGKIYFQSEEGTGVVILAKKKYELVAKNPLDERTLASVAATAGSLYMRSDKAVYRFQQLDPLPRD